MWLQLRMGFLVAILFAILYALITIAGTLLGFGGFTTYVVLAVGMMLIQYMIGPKMVEWSMKVKPLSEKDAPEIHRMVEDLAKKAGLPKPRIGISETQVPNAFAYGRWKSDARVCVTRGILNLVNKEELKAVLGHELSHIKHRDVLVITMISVIPTIAWYLAMSTMYSRGNGENRGSLVLLGVLAFVIYFLTNLLVMYGSRLREYYADQGAIKLGENPHHLASALYKLVYGAAKTPPGELKKVEGMKAFFLSDPSRARNEFADLRALDKDLSGTIDKKELEAIRTTKLKLTFGERMLELLSTHPNMLKRIARLAKY